MTVLGQPELGETKPVEGGFDTVVQQVEPVLGTRVFQVSVPV